MGSRAASPYGERVAADVAFAMAEAGFAVMSGSAFGIDPATHRGASASGRAGLPTVAVLACGIDRSYPAAHAALLNRIGQSGAVVSEHPPGTTPSRVRFLVRNRLVAALGAGTVVVEAGRRSGTVATAAVAERLSRPLMVVPGPATSAMSVGCHALLHEPGRILVTGDPDVLLPGSTPLDRDERAGGDDDLGLEAKSVMDACATAPGRRSMRSPSH